MLSGRLHIRGPSGSSGVLAAKYMSYMLPSKTECARCAGEAWLLWSMCQGYDTRYVALGAWGAWLADCHCGSSLKCRGCTWLLVCLAQKEVHVWRLAFLSFLSLLTPLYGKRPGGERRSPDQQEAESGRAHWHGSRKLQQCSGRVAEERS